MILHFHILPPLTINPWWLVLPILLLVAVVIQIWILLETRRMKGNIERILDQTTTAYSPDKASADRKAVDSDRESPDSDTHDIDNLSTAKGAEEIWQPGRKISKMDRELLARIDAEIEANIQDSEYTIEIRVLLETHTVSRYVYKQLNSTASSIINDLMIGPDGF